MKLFKKALVIIMTICLACSFFGCESNSLKTEISQEDWDSYRHYVKLSTGIVMSYVEMGNPEGEVLVLQHGMTDNSRAWSLTAPYFAKAGYHIYMPDLRGQGKSQETDGYYTTITYATDLNAFFNAMNIDKAILVGHSLGSYTVQSFWMMFPEKCSKIVLVSSSPQKNYQNERLLTAYNYYFKNLLDDEHPSDAFMDNWYDCTCKEEKYAEEFKVFIDKMKKEAQALSKQSWINIIMGFITSNITDAYSTFDKTIPTLILHGNDDTMALTQYQEELCTLLNVSSDNYKNYSNVGHNIQYEIPEQFANDVLYWLQNGSLSAEI